MGFPVGAAIWTAVGGLAAYRALVRPARAVFDQGEVTSCPGGAGCDPGLGIRSTRGIASVYSLVSGTVVRSSPDRIDIVSSCEPVMVSYRGVLAPSLAPGQPVHAGKTIAQSAAVSVSVSLLQRQPDGSLSLVSIEPASWLSSRGLRAASKLAPGVAWCLGGRSLTIPPDVSRCGMRLPDPAGFSLLPVSARIA